MVGPPGMVINAPLPVILLVVMVAWSWDRWGDDVLALLARARGRRR